MTEEKKVDEKNNNDYATLKAEAENLANLVQRLNQDNQALKNSLQEFGEITPKEVKELKRVAKDGKIQNAKSEQDIQKLLEESEQALRKELGGEISKKEQSILNLSAELKELKVTDQVMNSIGGLFNNDTHVFIKDLIRKFVDLDDNGEFIVKGDSGKLAYSSKDASKKKTITEFAEDLIAKFPSMAKPKGIHQGSMQEGSANASGGTGLTKEQYLQNRANYPRAERVELDRKFNL